MSNKRRGTHKKIVAGWKANSPPAFHGIPVACKPTGLPSTPLCTPQHPCMTGMTRGSSSVLSACMTAGDMIFTP